MVHIDGLSSAKLGYRLRTRMTVSNSISITGVCAGNFEGNDRYSTCMGVVFKHTRLRFRLSTAASPYLGTWHVERFDGGAGVLV